MHLKSHPVGFHRRQVPLPKPNEPTKSHSARKEASELVCFREKFAGS